MQRLQSFFQSAPQTRFTKCHELSALPPLLDKLKYKVEDLKPSSAEEIGYIKHLILNEIFTELQKCVSAFNRKMTSVNIMEIYELVVEMQKILEQVQPHHFEILNIQRNAHKSSMQTPTTLGVYAGTACAAAYVFPLAILTAPLLAPYVNDKLKYATGLSAELTASAQIIHDWRIAVNALVANLQTYKSLHEAYSTRSASSLVPVTESIPDSSADSTQVTLAAADPEQRSAINILGA